MLDLISKMSSSSERKPLEVVKGVNGLDKVVLRQVNGTSAEVVNQVYIIFSLLVFFYSVFFTLFFRLCFFFEF